MKTIDPSSTLIRLRACLLVLLCLLATASVSVADIPPDDKIPPINKAQETEIRNLINNTNAADMDVDFMRKLYNIHPAACKTIGQIMADPSMTSKNMKMGQLRTEMDHLVWKELLKELKIRVEYTNQGKNNGIRSDLDYTLYYIAEEAGVPIHEVIEKHKQAWGRVHPGLTPDHVEIAVMNGDDFYPDWRNESLTADEYRTKVTDNLRRLRQNPEAYFVPGANKQQVHNRALRDGVTTIIEYDPIADKLVTVAEGRTEDLARRYDGVRGQYDYKNALGNLVQNPRQLLHQTDAIRRAKYFNRVVNEGLGNLKFFANQYAEIHASNLTASEKESLKLKYLTQALANQNLNDSQIRDFMRVIDISMEIELDKTASRADYQTKRGDYFKDYRQTAAHEVSIKNGGLDHLDPAERESQILAEQERLFLEDQKRVMAKSMLAGLEHSAKRDLTPKGMLRNKFRFAPDGKLIVDPDAPKKIAFDRALEIMQFYEVVNSSTDPAIRAMGQQAIDRAPTPELKRFYNQMSAVTTAEIDRFLNDAEYRRGSRIQMAFDELLREKRKILSDVGLRPEDGSHIPDEQIREHMIEAQKQRLNPLESARLTAAYDAARVTVDGWKREMYTKGTGLMMGSSAVNLIRAYQVGGLDAMPHAIFSESLNYMPDFIEIPFTILDAAWRLEGQGAFAAAWQVGQMGALMYFPTVGQGMLVYNIATGSFQIARTFIVNKIDDDIVEQALRSRPRDTDGNPFREGVHARRNPYKDSPGVKGDPPMFPLFFGKYKGMYGEELDGRVPEDEMSDYDLRIIAKVEMAAQINENLKTEGLQPESDKWERRTREIQYKYGFDLPYYRRMEKVYREKYTYIVYYDYFDHCMVDVLDWYSLQPEGYKREFQGYFDVFFGSGEEKVLNQIAGMCAAQFKAFHDAELEQEEIVKRNEEAAGRQIEEGAALEKSILATRNKVQGDIALSETKYAERIVEQAEQLRDQHETVVELEYPFTYATQEIPPSISIKVRALHSKFKHPLESTLDEEIVGFKLGAPSGWEPGEQWKERFDNDELRTLTMDYKYTATVKDADGQLVGTADMELPVVGYVPTFNGRVSVEVYAEDSEGNRYLYNGAEVTLGNETKETIIDGRTGFGDLEAGTYTVQVKPRASDDNHTEGSGSGTIVDKLATPTAEGDDGVLIEVVLPYKPDEPVAENNNPGEEGGTNGGENGGTSGGEGGDNGGGDQGGNGGEGGGNGGGEGGGEGGGNGGGEGGGEGGGNGGGNGGGTTGPSIDDIIRQLPALTSQFEATRDQAIADCNYVGAAQAQQQVVDAVQQFLGQTFVNGIPAQLQTTVSGFEQDLAELNRAAQAESQAKDLLRSAQSLLRAKEVEQAMTTLEQAILLPDLASCLKDRIVSLYNRIDADLKERSAQIDAVLVAANQQCNFKEALRLGEEIERDAPTLSWVQTELPKIRRLAQEQQTGNDLLQQAQALEQQAASLATTDDKRAAVLKYNEAIQKAEQARDAAPDCDKDKIQAYIDALVAKARAVANSAQPQQQASNVTIDRSLMLVIDASGSMQDQGKIEQAKSAASQTVRSLGSNVEVGVMTYSGSCAGGWRVLQDLTTNKESVITAIQGISPGGGTPMSPAVRFVKGYMESNAKSHSGQIILLSDGQDNCGGVREAGESLAQSSMSLRLDAVGLGLAEGSQAENDLSTLVRASGNGTQYSAGNSEELVRAFRRASLSDQLKMSDPSQDPAVDAYLQAAYNETLEYIRNNDLLSALQVLKGVANEHPNAPSAQNNLSLLYEADGQTVSAINHAEAYLRLAPNALDAGDVRARLDQLRREQQQNPRAIFNPNECSTLYRWARAESMRISDATRKAKAYMIMNAAQRGDCGTANTEYENYTQTYGQN